MNVLKMYEIFIASSLKGEYNNFQSLGNDILNNKSI